MKEWIKTGKRRQNTTKNEWIKTGEETKYNKERMD